MKQFQTYVAVLCAVLVAAPSTFGQQNPGVETRGPLGTERPHWYSGVAEPYQSRVVPPVNLSNSSRIDALLRAGNLYLSLLGRHCAGSREQSGRRNRALRVFPGRGRFAARQSRAGINGIPTGVLPGIPTGAGFGLLGSTGTGIGSAGAASPLVPGLSYDPFLTGTSELRPHHDSPGEHGPFRNQRPGHRQQDRELWH